MSPASHAALRLCGAFAVLPTTIVVGHLIDAGDWGAIACGVVFAFALACAVLSLFELREALSHEEDADWPTRALRIFISLPQALFGLFTLCCGLAIIVWVLFNTFVERQPEYSGGFLTFGMSTGMTVYGYRWLRGAFGRWARSGDGPSIP
ncbi:MAG: hypothetical protein ACTHOH_02100 [Lysobacteraceae bacterium]